MPGDASSDELQPDSTTAGPKNLTATYNGDADYNASPASAPLAHTVNPAATTASIGSINPTATVIGQNYTVSASASVNAPGSGTLTGTITVSDGTNNCSIVLPALSCSLPSTGVGSLTISATYAGNVNYAASPAATLGHIVTQAGTTATIISTTPNPSPAGQNFVVSYSVTVDAPGAGTPTGTVTISDGMSSCVGQVADGQCTLSLPANGTYNLTATYSGATNFEGSVSATFVHQVCVSANPIVSNTADAGAGSLREALAGVCSGGAVTFSPDFNVPQTITLTGEIAINDDMTITGPGALLLTINANGAGRAFNITGGNIILSGMTITGGSSSNGGGIANLGGTVTLTNSVVTGNSASDLGGGIYSTSAMTIVGSTVSSNAANSLTGATGGGIHSTGALTMVNSTVSGNSVPNGDNSGGGIRVEGASSIINATIANNAASGATSASGMLQISGLVTLRNTIVVANQSNATVPDTAGAFDPTSAYNLIGNVGTASGFSIANQNQTGTSSAVLDPRLGLLANNGGTTQTHAISLSSPAVDKGSAVVVPLALLPPLTTDQRGLMRPIDQPLAPNAPGGDASDIGAYELLAPTAANVGVSGRVLTANGSGLATATVVLAGPDGEREIVRTNLQGYFRFAQVEVGRTYTIEVTSKFFTFNPQTVTVQDEITELNFTPIDF